MSWALSPPLTFLKSAGYLKASFCFSCFWFREPALFPSLILVYPPSQNSLSLRPGVLCFRSCRQHAPTSNSPCTPAPPWSSPEHLDFPSVLLSSARPPPATYAIIKGARSDAQTLSCCRVVRADTAGMSLRTVGWTKRSPQSNGRTLDSHTFLCFFLVTLVCRRSCWLSSA